jgi:hypothetical protein
VDVVKTPEAIRTMRNLLLLAKFLGNIEPELFGPTHEPSPEAINKGSVGSNEPSAIEHFEKPAIMKDQLPKPDCDCALLLTIQ